MASYEKTKDGAWVQPIRRGYKMSCCDCGLVHTLNFRVVDSRTGKLTTKGIIQFQATRNNRSTALVRRHRRAKGL